MEIQNLVFHINGNQLLPIIVLYVGPETILPLTSFLAAAVGVLLMFWRYVVGLIRRAWRFLVRKAG
jgi:hypothetical protein